jgi:Uma2 family endonuclease
VTVTAETIATDEYVEFVRKLTSSHEWTAADYASIPEDVICEIYDGGLHVTPSPTAGHQRAALDLSRIFESFVDRFLVTVDVDVRAGDDIFQPDVIVMKERFEGRPVPASNVQVAAEVISDNENVERTIKKVAYARAGIPAYVVIDGKRGKRTAEIYRLAGSAYELVALVPHDGRLTLAEPFAYVMDMDKINK